MSAGPLASRAVLVADFAPATARLAAEALRAAGAQVRICAGPLDEAGWAAMAAGGLDAVVLALGPAPTGPLLAQGLGDLEAACEASLVAALLAARALGEALRGRGGSLILLDPGLDGQPRGPLAQAMAAGLVNLTRSLALALAAPSPPVRVNLIKAAPGLTSAEQAARLGQLAVYFASPASSYQTGTALA